MPFLLIDILSVDKGALSRKYKASCYEDDLSPAIVEVRVTISVFILRFYSQIKKKCVTNCDFSSNARYVKNYSIAFEKSINLRLPSYS